MKIDKYILSRLKKKKTLIKIFNCDIYIIRKLQASITQIHASPMVKFYIACSRVSRANNSYTKKYYSSLFS